MLGKKLLVAFMALILYVSFSTFAQAKDLEDGTYTLKYEVLKAGESSVSIANDYFKKPAHLIVKDGKLYVDITIKKSHWTKRLAINGEKETVLSKNKKADERVGQFPLKAVAKQQAEIDVYINEKVDGEDFLYDNSYQIQFDFDKSSLKKQSDTPTAVKAATEKSKEQAAAKGKIEEKSSKLSSYLVYGLFIIVCLALVMIVGKQIRGRKS